MTTGRYSEIQPAKVREPASPAPLQLASKSDRERWATLEAVLGRLARSAERAEAYAEAANENTARMVRSLVETNRGLDALAARLGVVEARPPTTSGVSGAIAAVTARASQSEAAIVEQLRFSNMQLKAELEQARRERELEAVSAMEASRARRKLITNVVVWLTVGGGGITLLAAGLRACGG